MKHMAQGDVEKEMQTALLFDLRDNPRTLTLVNHLVDKHGSDGRDTFIALLKEDMENSYRKDPRPPLFPWTRSALQTAINGGVNYELLGLGQWGALIGGAIQALAAVGSSVYSAKLAASTQLKIAKINVDSQNQQAAAVQAAAAAQQAAVQNEAVANVTGSPMPGRAPAQAGMMGMGTGGTLLAVGAVGVAGMLIFKKLKG